MEAAFRIAPKESELSVYRKNKVGKEKDPLASNHIKWYSRYRCFQAYICFVLSYLTALKFCERMGKYRVTIFVPYFVFNIFIGVPAVLVEVLVGRFVMANVSQAWEMCSPARGVFWCLFLNTVFSINLNYIFSICLLKYLFSSVAWDTCSEWWNDVKCYTIGKKKETVMNCLKNNSEDFCNNQTWESSGRQFWQNNATNTTYVSGIIFSLLMLALSVFIIAAIIYKGIRSLELVLSLLVYPCVVFWMIFLVGTFSSSIALRGHVQLFVFNASELIKPQIWLEGFEDTFFILGLGRLSLSFISSHGRFTDDILKDVMVVIFVSIASSLLLATPILSIVAQVKSLDGVKDGEPLFKDLADVYISMSEAFLFYPPPQALWSTLHYLNSYLISVSSQAVLVLGLCEAIVGITNKAFFVVIIIVSCLSCVVTGGVVFTKDVLNINHATNIATTVMLCTITWQLFYGIRKFNYDYFFMMGYPVPLFLKCTWITLLILPFVGLILLMYYKIPHQPVEYIVYIYVGITLTTYLIPLLIQIIKTLYHKEKISTVFTANPDWGPGNALLKKSRSVFDTSSVTREFMYRQELYKKPLIKPPDFSQQNVVHLI